MSQTGKPEDTAAELLAPYADSGLLTAYRDAPDGCIQEWIHLMHRPMPPMAGFGLEVCTAFAAVLVALLAERAERYATGNGRSEKGSSPNE